MAESNITSAGTGDWNAGATWTGGAVPDTDQHAIIQSGHNVTINADDEVKSLSVQGGGTLTGNSSYSITVNGEGNATYGTNHYAIDLDGVIGTNVKLILTYNGTTALDLAGSSGTVNSLTINHADCVANLETTGSLAGDLSITAGEFKTNNNALTVTGDCIVGNGVGSANTAILDGNASAISFGSLAIDTDGKYIATSGTTTITSERSDGFAINHDGNFVHSDGTVTVTTAATTKMDLIGTGTLYNLIINASGNINQWDGNTTIANDLTITAGTFQPYSAGNTLTVTGNVIAGDGSGSANTAVLGGNSGSGAMTFGSLTIDSDGKYIATSGTTTLNSGGANGDASTSLHGTGTFTHNKGTLHFASGAQYRIPLGGTFYNVTTDVQLYGYAGSLSPQAKMPDGTTATDFISIEGTFRINNASVYPYSWDGLYVHNLIIGDGTGSANSAKLSLAESDVFNGTVYVDNVTINSDGQFLFGDGDETSATAGSSALNIYGAFRNLGGSVDIT